MNDRSISISKVELGCPGGGWAAQRVLKWFDTWAPREVQTHRHVFYCCSICHDYHLQAIPSFEW